MQDSSSKFKEREKGSALRWFLVAVLAILVISLIFSIIKMTINYLNVKGRFSELKNNIDSITEEQKDIQQKLNSLKDPAFLEIEARTKFNYQLPGEHVFVFLEPSLSPSPAIEKNWWYSSVIGAFVEKLGENPKSWIEYFFGFTLTPN